MKTAANILSWVFQPLLLPTFSFFLIWFSNPLWFSGYSSQKMQQVFLILIINTFVFPALSIILLRKLGFLQSLTMNDQRERSIPFIACGVFYVWAYVVFRKSGLPQIINIAVLGACITLFTTFLINLFYKISIHSAGAAALVMITFFSCYLSGSPCLVLLSLLIPLAGMIGTSRLILQAHTSGEVFSGYAIGILSQLIAIRFF